MLEQKYEKYQNFYLKIFIFLVVNFSVYLNRLVFIMMALLGELELLLLASALKTPFLIIATDKALFFIRKMLISFLFLDENICCGHSLEAPRRGASNEYPQHMFSSRNKNNNMWIPPFMSHDNFILSWPIHPHPGPHPHPDFGKFI